MIVTHLNSYVLHVVPANGGGVDRYVRDICASRSHDAILHVADTQYVFELPFANILIPVDRGNDDAWLDLIGTPMLVHAHSTLPLVSDTVFAICAAKAIEYVLTLHDILFDAHTSGTLRAATRIVPSLFIRDRLLEANPNVGDTLVIANGVDCAPPSAAHTKIDANINGVFELAVVGALGEHKGLSFLKEVIEYLPPQVRVVLIGYAEDALTPGWMVPERLWVHGVFQTKDLAEILDRYGVRFVLFPNRQPESFSYTLSDVWCAQRPALVPDVGALGERMRRVERGAAYAADSSAKTVAEMLAARLIGDEPLSAQLPYAPESSVASMCQQLTAVYAQHATKILSSSTAQIASVKYVGAARHLNGQFFRAELMRLTGDLMFANQQLEEASRTQMDLTHQAMRREEWVTKLEGDVASIQAGTVRLTVQWQADVEQLTQDAQKLMQDVQKLTRDVDDTLAQAHRFERALAVLPRPLRRWVLSRADRTQPVSRS
jgi:glycosyltransferase involved in cell wall biosynthesis